MGTGQQSMEGGGYQKSFTPGQDGGFKSRNAFVKPDFNGNPRGGNLQQPPFQSKPYMGNKPRTPFSGPNRFSSDFGGPQQKFNKFDSYKGGYGGLAAAEGGDNDKFQVITINLDDTTIVILEITVLLITRMQQAVVIKLQVNHLMFKVTLMALSLTQI